MEKNYSKAQLEDKALKSASMYFGRELLPYLGINSRIIRLLPTEQIRLEAVRANEDLLFEMEDGTLAHFEFESVEVTRNDLYRFRAYDAYTGMKYKKAVTTYVLCSGKTGKIHSKLKEGINIYQIIPLQMKEKDADRLFCELKVKAQKRNLLKKDLAPLLLTPLMGGESSVKDRIRRAGKMLDTEADGLSKEEKQCMEAVLYAFACKFLKKHELSEIKEAFSMTVLGEMIWSDGEKKGIEKGIEALILDNLEEGILRDKILLKLVQRFDLTQEQAITYFNRFSGKQAERY